MNLLLTKQTPEGLHISYAYLPGTNLCTQELHHYNGKIQERLFRFYDDNGELQGIIEDDGSAQSHTDLTDVTYAKEKLIYSVKEQTPSFGKPQQIIEKHLDQVTNKMTLQLQREFTYDAAGNEVGQKVYDAAGNFCYETKASYDGRRRLTSKTDPEGVVTQYEYHDNNKISCETRGNKQTVYTYDKADRLICKEERHPNGDTFTNRYVYNALNQLISEIDPYGHETTYEYNRLGHLIKTTYPQIEKADGGVYNPTETKTYNILGQVISHTDLNGHTTHYLLTARGDPVQITYPDGSFERYDYHLTGFLKQKWETDGTSTTYTQDAKGRLLSCTWCDDKGTLLKQEEYRYKGSLLVYQKDPMGIETFYTHDGAGRKIEEKTLDQRIHYTYDCLNRPICITQQDQQEVLEYDWKNQILSKTLQDTHGTVYAKTSYLYDNDGNIIQKTIHNDTPAIYKSRYHTDGSILSSEDPLGNTKTWVYHHNHYNGAGHQVQCREIFDPLGREIREADDIHHRLARRDIYDNNAPVSISHSCFDPLGNLIKQSTRVMDQGIDTREYTVEWCYNSRGKLSSETAQGLTTLYSYDTKNRLIHKTKPDGVLLHYTYDALDRLIQLTSSDGTISYAYTYDLHNNPIEIQDHIHNITQKRRYDPFDRILEEELQPHITLHYQYDPLGRLTQVTLPDASLITYDYDPFHLRTIKRPTYSILCQQYDQTGRLLKITTPAGPITYTYDLLGRATSIQSPEWQSHHTRIDPVGNVLTVEQKDPQGTHESHFTYDRFNNLCQEPTQNYRYDSLGNCLEKNHIAQHINSHNQITHDGQSSYTYDLNGNLLSIADHTAYRYDALNRLIACTQDEHTTTFLYDAFNRCLKISTPHETKHLLYQQDKEIGSIQNGKLQEFRLIHPEKELTFAIEQNNTTLFPVQDQQYNICTLYTPNGTLAQWTRYTPFGNQITFGDTLTSWNFANRRQICGLTLFTDRLYNPHIMRWLTTDPIRFQDTLNLYTYNHNNPFRFTDPHGRFAFVLALPAVFVFGMEGIAFALTAQQVAMAVAITATFAGTYYGSEWVNRKLEHMHLEKLEEETKQEEVQEKDKKGKEEWVFPENPDDLLPELPRDKRGRIQAADNLRIRPEKHEMEEGETHNPRHHDQHYHVETRRDPSKGWKNKNTTKLKPVDYNPGSGTGFLVGESYPGG